ncbi:MAG TPA: glucose-1-phosphate thymidylyltransferase RfbA [Nocardiopsis listeri]|uniref:glucose-1-phosphate thymidylyltransferase RfbA n=1 Tax=Nocardiopsis TaxID=2013 RepID=UPI001D5A5125|nr:glucose-1-phosphate thymidylyltransferase RfbA [Nocardiopsis listeri]HJE57220.1 glucose-1-phosphate thymidylyltransferase RfbA [Nocardiopsis listeri]
MKGILLAGGSGTRLHPATISISKQILPVYNKPMIYYPLSVLMLAGVRDILIITTPRDMALFRGLLGDGSWLGINLTYAEQTKPRGIAEAFVLGADHVGDDSSALILGDNIFHGPVFSSILQDKAQDVDGCVLFGYPVNDPSRYGVGVTDDQGRLTDLQEKPAEPRSNRAVTGLYFYDSTVVDIAKDIRPSERGELEITDVNRIYMEQGRAEMVDLGRGFAWLDTGTHDTFLQACQFVQVMEQRQGIRIACLEEVALRMGYIDAESCYRLGAALGGNDYGNYVMRIAEEKAMGKLE